MCALHSVSLALLRACKYILSGAEYFVCVVREGVVEKA